MATPAQSIVWTTLPRGFVTLPDGRRTLGMSVLVSPRLSPLPNDETLAPFKLFHDWPAIVEGQLHFSLIFNDGIPTPAERVPGEDAPDSDLWKRLFDEKTFVRAHAFTDLKNEVIRSFPAADIHAYVQDLYSWAAADHGQDLPERSPPSSSPENPLSRLARQLGGLAHPPSRERLAKSFEAQLTETKVVPPGVVPQGFTSREEFAFYQAGRFYDRPKPANSNPYSEQPKPELAPPPPARPEFDFHQALTAFADYPRLLRRLGLVIDLVWTEPVPIASSGRVRVEVAWADPQILPPWHGKDTPPWTAYLVEAGTHFRARATAAASDLNHGCLDLSAVRDEPAGFEKEAAPYFVTQVDLDGSALKTLDFAGNLLRMARPDVSNFRTPKKTGLPALRTAGLALYRTGRAVATRHQLLRAAIAQGSYSGGGRPEFFAEDLLRGFRLDVWDDVSKDWHPLCAREGRYLFRNGGDFTLELADEGYVKGASVSRAEPGAPGDLYLHERLAGFDGWSLVAARPGRTLDKDPSAVDPVVPVEDAGTQFGFATKFRPAKGSLPRLRFGRSYRLRVRLVDLAGNSVTLKEADDKLASQPFLYTRHEPVPSPALLLRARVTEGESLEHLVIRSDFDATAEDYVKRADVEAALEAVRDRLALTGDARAGYAYSAGNERHVAPPKTSQLEAECHGRFDAFIGPGKDHAKGFRLALRESGTFLSRTIVNLATGADDPIPGLDLELVAPPGEDPTDLDDPSRLPGEALKQGEYVLHKEEQLVVPYLPDPFAAGVAFVGLPGWPQGEPFIITFPGDWPDPRPFRIRLVERPGVMNGCSQSFSSEGKPLWDAVQHQLTIFLPKGVETTVRYSSLLASEEEARQMALWKWLEQRGKLSDQVHRLILTGRHWMFTPWRTLTLVHAVQHPLCPPTIMKWSGGRTLGDTFASLRGLWRLSVKSTAKVDLNAAWLEPVDDVAQETWQVLERSAHVAEVHIEPMFSDDHPVPAAEPGSPPLSQQPLHHEFGDTRHRRVRYRLKGTTRFREYFPIELTRHEHAITRQGPEFSPEAPEPGIVVPSSARPAAPRPVHVIPTFLWEETPVPGGGIVRRRRGNGLRVYLERPWWSSGENERLGVVFKAGAIENRHKPFVTQWGLDPVFDSAAPASGPTLAAFPLRKESAPGNLSLEELGTTERVFAAAGHSVEFDGVRKLWFSDIVVNAGASYFPFIRLALARYQHHSIPDCHLSRVVLTDFIQLVPDRTLDVRPLSARKFRVKIFGIAPTETFVSRILSAATARSATTTQAISDIMPSAPTAAQITQAFKAGPLTEIAEAGRIPLKPGRLTPKAEPVAPSKRIGLNEYTVIIEKLPDGASPEFGWVAETGYTVTKPPPPPAPPATPALKVPTKKTATKKPLTRKAATVPTKVSPAKLAAAGKLTPEAVAKLPSDVLGLAIPPLWEGDVTLPTTNDNLPRRMVVQEHELFFKATPKPGEFIPIARRLVYADIIEFPLPGVTR